MSKDKKIGVLGIAARNLKAKKFRTIFMMFFVMLMTATFFFTDILLTNMELGIQNTTQRMGADIIVIPEEGTEDIRDSLFAGEPCSLFFDRGWEDKLREMEGVNQVSSQLYMQTMAASCCDEPVQIIAFDPETDFVLKPWLEGQTDFNLRDDQIVVGGGVFADVGASFYLYGNMYEIGAKLEKTGMGYDNSVFMTYDAAAKLKESESGQANLPEDLQNLTSMILVDADDNFNKHEIFTLKVNIQKAGDEAGGLYAGTADELLSGISAQVRKLSGYGNILTYIMVVSTALALISIFVITINERKYEFGILYTLGASKGQMTRIILSEALMISVGGCVAGVGIAYYLMSSFKNVISVKLEIPYFSLGQEQIVPAIVVCFMIALVTGVVAAVCSAYGISRGEAYRLIRESE